MRTSGDDHDLITALTLDELEPAIERPVSMVLTRALAMMHADEVVHVGTVEIFNLAQFVQSGHVGNEVQYT